MATIWNQGGYQSVDWSPAQLLNQGYAVNGGGQPITPRYGYGPATSGGGGSVLGASTANLGTPTAPAPAPAPAPAGNEQSLPSGFDESWNQYFSQLDNILGNLEGQKTSQESTIQGQYQQGVGDINLQQTQGLEDLAATTRKTEASQTKNLSDLSGSIRNQMMAGQNLLGARGAGDSSAANMYAYALTKLGTQARGELMGRYAEIKNEIAGRITNLKNTVANELNRLSAIRNQALNSVAQWFAEQQNAVYQAKGAGAQQKSQEILNYAMQVAQQANASFQNRQAMLQQWALNNASSLQQAVTNLQAISGYAPVQPSKPAISGMPNISSTGATASYVPGYSGASTDKYDIYGNKIA